MRAAVLRAPRLIETLEVEAPKPPQGWALVRSELVGICGTDKAFYAGSYRPPKTPLIPGHEVVGRVVEGPEELVGLRVVPEINFPCWRCQLCRGGLYTHCPNKRTLGIDFDGGMAEYFAAPAEALHAFRGPPERGIFVEPLAAALRALSLSPPRPHDRVAVIGTGALAWLTVQALRGLYGLEADVVVRRGSLKAGRFRGVARVVPADEAEDSGYDVVFEVSGDPHALSTALRLVKPRGVVHLKSTPGATATVNTTVAVVKEVLIVGSRCGTFREFRRAVELLETGKIEASAGKVYPLEEAPGAFEEALRGHYLRVAVAP